MESKIDGLAQQNDLIDGSISRNEENDDSVLLDGLHGATYNLVLQGYAKSGGQKPEKAGQNIILRTAR
ncbi:MAG: hypothetical protein WBM35_10845 [Candidatus Electrothrix sp.]